MANPVAPTPLSVVQKWHQHPKSVPLARAALRAALKDWDMADVADAAGLVLCELMTNAVRHARSGAGDAIEVRYEPRADGGVHLEVQDGDAAHLPRMQHSTSDAEHGRGLQLVHNITRGRWGTQPCPDRGKFVWANVPAC